MARDYAKKNTKSKRTPAKRRPPSKRSTGARSRKTKPETSSRTGLIWMLAGLLVGLLIAGLVYLKLNDQGGKSNQKTTAKTHKTVKVAPPASKKTHKSKKMPATDNTDAQRPKFEFYTILPSVTVEPHEQVIPKAQLPEPTSPTTTPGNQYLVQVAALRKAQDAESLKARLALMGFEADITQTVQKGVTWNRVYIGPFATQAIAKSNQTKLKQQGMTSIILVKKPT